MYFFQLLFFLLAMMNTSKMINSSKIANSSMQKSYK